MTTPTRTLPAALRRFRRLRRSEALRGPLVACIGPITAETAEELGLRVDVVAEEYTVEGLVRALVETGRHAIA